MARANFTDISILALPMRTRFRQLDTREVAIFRGERWSEFSAFVEYPDSEAATWLRAALSWANEPLPPIKRQSVGVNATLPAVRPGEIFQTLSAFGNFRSVKIKVAEAGQSIREDLERIRETRNLFPNAKVRLDANGNFTLTQALELIEKLDLENFEYFEQPVETISEMRELRLELQKRSIPLKIAADELIRKAADPYLVAKEEACDIAVLKVQPLGGIDAAQKIAKSIGIDVVVSSALESSVGLSQGLRFAAALENLNYDSGLGTAALLAGDVTDKPLIPSDGLLEVREVIPSPELLEKYQAAPKRRDWWLARIDRCLEILES